ncbi:MAG: 30S ribosomal protein S20 [Patescibacteria group bacterium]
MPILKNAKKALRQSIKRAKRNTIRTDEITSLRRHFKVAVKGNQLDKAKELAAQIGQKIDKAVGKKIVKMNTAARVKSRMAKAMSAISGGTIKK